VHNQSSCHGSPNTTTSCRTHTATGCRTYTTTSLLHVGHQPEGTLIVALSTFPNTLDGNLTAERNAHNTAAYIYDSLVWIDDDGEIEPALAESWEISEDGLEYIFNLRQDVTFHNGEQFNADAVVYSWEYYRNPELAWNERWRMADKVEKVDDIQ
jgi:peptide/nickel transport system substrate-binding protein